MQEGVCNLLHVRPVNLILLKKHWVGLCSEANLSLVVAPRAQLSFSLESFSLAWLPRYFPMKLPPLSGKCNQCKYGIFILFSHSSQEGGMYKGS